MSMTTRPFHLAECRPECMRRYLCYKVRASIISKQHLREDSRTYIQYMTLRDIAVDLATMCEEFVGLSGSEVKRLKRRLFQVRNMLCDADSIIECWIVMTAMPNTASALRSSKTPTDENDILR